MVGFPIGFSSWLSQLRCEVSVVWANSNAVKVSKVFEVSTVPKVFEVSTVIKVFKVSTVTKVSTVSEISIVSLLQVTIQSLVGGGRGQRVIDKLTVYLHALD